ncbi:MAG: hypothetical protein EOP24_32110 [Hyphomicrobiales bacterium]|nr:MAG: hypothetical protein EOP24_32110 [Hyphomicrobiales bacterium]
MTPRNILLVAAAALIATGMFLGLRSLELSDYVDPVACGSAFSPSLDAARANDRAYATEVDEAAGANIDAETTEAQDECGEAVDSRRPLAYGALGLGGVALIASIVASSSRNVNRESKDQPSWWR